MRQRNLSTFYQLIFVFLLLPISLLAQEGQNPFDIGGTPYVPSPVTTNTTTIEETAPKEDSTATIIPSSIPSESTSSTASNPFDIGTNQVTPTVVAPIETTPKRQEQKTTSVVEQQNIPTPSRSSNQGFLMIVLGIMLVLIAVVTTLFRSFMGKAYQAFINDSQLRSAFREITSIVASPYIILYFIYAINLSIFIYLVLSKYDFSLGTWGTLAQIFGGIAAIFLIKHMTLSLLGYIFPVEKEMDVYNFMIVIFNVILGILMVPLNLLLAYAPENLTFTVLYGGFGLIILMYLYRSLRGILIAGKYIALHKFHFFMYLCTVEIAPIFILVKIVMNLSSN